MIYAKEETINCNGAAISSHLLRLTHYHSHFHPNAIELIYVLDGSLRLYSAGVNVTLYKDDTFAIDPGDIHYCSSDTENLVLITHLEPTGVSSSIISSSFFAFESQNATSFQASAIRSTKNLLLANAMLDPTQTNINDIRLKFAARITDMLITYFDWLSYIWNPQEPLGASQMRIRRIINYCLENNDRKINVSALADAEHVSETYISVIMQKTSFGSFRNFVNFSRCYKAEKLLLTTDMKIVDISPAAGFSDPKYFYTSMRNYFECTPHELRKQHHNFNTFTDSFESIDYPESHDLLQNYLYDHFLADALSTLD